MFTFRKMGTQVRCAQNRYIAVQTDLKYPLFVETLLAIHQKLPEPAKFFKK